MMGSRQVAQGALFYEFSLEDHVTQDHLIRLHSVISSVGSGPDLNVARGVNFGRRYGVRFARRFIPRLIVVNS
jgi:hypothetical protein